MLAIGLSLAACVGWGVADYLGGLKSRHLPVLTVLMFSTVLGLGLIIPVVWARGQALPDNPALIALGFVDALATVAWAIATTQGLLSLVAVIGSLYPAVTVLLAVILLKEQPQFVQAIGVILAVIGVVLISAG